MLCGLEAIIAYSKSVRVKIRQLVGRNSEIHDRTSGQLELEQKNKLRGRRAHPYDGSTDEWLLLMANRFTNACY